MIETSIANCILVALEMNIAIIGFVVFTESGRQKTQAHPSVIAGFVCITQLV